MFQMSNLWTFEMKIIGYTILKYKLKYWTIEF